jgi:hypothetical protein
VSTALSLAALLAAPRTGGVRLVAGREAEWRDVVVETAEADLPDRADGALAVLTSAGPPTPWQTDALLRRVRDRGFTGLALPEPAREVSRDLAERLGVVVLAAQRPTQLARACWELLAQRDALTLTLVRRVAQSIEYHAEDLRDLLRDLAANLGHAVALVDRDEVLLEVGHPLPPRLHAALDFAGWAHTVRTDDGGAASVRVDSPTRGGLRLVLHDRVLTDAQLAALTTVAEVAMPMVAARLLIDEVVALSDVSRSSGLLGDFLEQRGVPDAEVARRMRERGWRTIGYHVGFRMVARHRAEPVDLAQHVSRRLGAIPVDSHVTTRGRGVTGWLSYTEVPSAATLADHIALLRRLHTDAQSQYSIATGVGTLREGGPGLSATLGEAADAARLATTRASTGWFLHIDRLGLEQLLLAWTGNDTFAPAARSLLGPLSPADLRTLSAYLDHESQVAATATALGVHRNTVTTRMQRIQEELGVDLTDPDARLAVHLACRTVVPPADAPEP